MNGGTVETDYDRACAVDGWPGVIMVGAAEALILRHEATWTLILTPSDAELTIVRSICADSDADLLRDITQATAPLADAVVFCHATEQHYRLFMAQDFLPWLYPLLDVELRPGSKRITSQYITTKSSSCIVNRLWPAVF